jgi:hypothetical protein
MSNGFQFFEGSTTINSASPQATVRRSGQVILSQAAVELLGEGVEQVQVGYNAKSGAVGIRSAAEGGRGALRLRKQPNGRSRLIDAKRFFAHHGLVVGQVRRLPVDDSGSGIIAFQLEPGPVAGDEAEATSKPAAGKGRKSGS